MIRNSSKRRKKNTSVFPIYADYEASLIRFLKTDFRENNPENYELVKGSTSYATKALFSSVEEMRQTLFDFYDIYRTMYQTMPFIRVWRCVEIEEDDDLMFAENLGVHWAYTRRAAYEFCTETIGFQDYSELVMLTGMVSRDDVNWRSSIKHGIMFSFSSFMGGTDDGEDELIISRPEKVRDITYRILPEPNMNG